MTIEQANQYFAALPEGFAPAEELRAALNDFLNGRAEITLLGGCDGYFPL